MITNGAFQIQTCFHKIKKNVGKVDLSQGYWNPQRKLGEVINFSEIISLESRRKLLTAAFF